MLFKIISHISFNISYFKSNHVTRYHQQANKLNQNEIDKRESIRAFFPFSLLTKDTLEKDKENMHKIAKN